MSSKKKIMGEVWLQMCTKRIALFGCVLFSLGICAMNEKAPGTFDYEDSEAFVYNEKTYQYKKTIKHNILFVNFSIQSSNQQNSYLLNNQVDVKEIFFERELMDEEKALIEKFIFYFGANKGFAGLTRLFFRKQRQE